MSVSTTVPPREQTQQKLDRRSAIAARYLASLPYTTADRLEDSARQFGERSLVLEGLQRYSYAEVNRRANQVARALRQQGVVRGDVVALAMENRAAFFFAWFGIAKLGAVVAFINTHVSGRLLQHALEVTGARHAIVGGECSARFAEVEDLALWHWPDAGAGESCGPDLQALAGAQDGGNVPQEWRDGLRAGDTAQYIFTSGTTGLPKAAIVSHARWLMAGDCMQELWGMGVDDCMYCFLPLYHGAASMSLTSTALGAGSAILVRRKFSRSEFWTDVRRHGVTFCQYVGEICRFLLSAPAGR